MKMAFPALKPTRNLVIVALDEREQKSAGGLIVVGRPTGLRRAVVLAAGPKVADSIVAGSIVQLGPRDGFPCTTEGRKALLVDEEDIVVVEAVVGSGPTADEFFAAAFGAD